MEKTDYKQITIDALKKAGANMDNLAFRYYEKSPYHKKHLKPEFDMLFIKCIWFDTSTTLISYFKCFLFHNDIVLIC